MKLPNLKFEDIKGIVLSGLKRTGSMIKEAMKLPYAKTYVLLSLLLTIFFIFITFPYGVLIRSQIQKLEKGVFRSIYMGDLNFNLIGTSTCEDASVVLRNGTEIDFREMILDANILSLLVNSLLKSDLSIDGSLGLNGIRVITPDIKMTMNINSNIDIEVESGQTVPRDGTIKIIVQNALMEFGQLTLPKSMGGFPLDLSKLKFTSIIVNASIKNNKCLLDKVKISGPDLRGSLKGTIALNRIFLNSRLNCTITIDSTSPALDPYRDLISKFADSENKIKIPLKGTISNPRVEIESLLNSSMTGEDKNTL